MKHLVFVVSVRDWNGEYIPMAVGETRKDAYYILEKVKDYLGIDTRWNWKQTFGEWVEIDDG